MSCFNKNSFSNNQFNSDNSQKGDNNLFMENFIPSLNLVNELSPPEQQFHNSKNLIYFDVDDLKDKIHLFNSELISLLLQNSFYECIKLIDSKTAPMKFYNPNIKLSIIKYLLFSLASTEEQYNFQEVLAYIYPLLNLFDSNGKVKYEIMLKLQNFPGLFKSRYYRLQKLEEYLKKTISLINIETEMEVERINNLNAVSNSYCNTEALIYLDENDKLNKIEFEMAYSVVKFFENVELIQDFDEFSINFPLNLNYSNNKDDIKKLEMSVEKFFSLDLAVGAKVLEDALIKNSKFNNNENECSNCIKNVPDCKTLSLNIEKNVSSIELIEEIYNHNNLKNCESSHLNNIAEELNSICLHSSECMEKEKIFFEINTEKNIPALASYTSNQHQFCCNVGSQSSCVNGNQLNGNQILSKKINKKGQSFQIYDSKNNYFGSNNLQNYKLKDTESNNQYFSQSINKAPISSICFGQDKEKEINIKPHYLQVFDTQDLNLQSKYDSTAIFNDLDSITVSATESNIGNIVNKNKTNDTNTNEKIYIDINDQKFDKELPQIDYETNKLNKIKNCKLSSLKSFNFKSFKRENMDKRIIRRFRKYIELQIKQNENTNYNYCFNSFIEKKLFPPFTLEYGVSFKSFNTSYMLWLFSQKDIPKAFDDFILTTLVSCVDMIVKSFNVSDIAEVGMIRNYLLSMSKVYCQFSYEEEAMDKENPKSTSSNNSIKPKSNKSNKFDEFLTLGQNMNGIIEIPIKKKSSSASCIKKNDEIVNPYFVESNKEFSNPEFKNPLNTSTDSLLFLKSPCMNVDFDTNFNQNEHENGFYKNSDELCNAFDHYEVNLDMNLDY